MGGGKRSGRLSYFKYGGYPLNASGPLYLVISIDKLPVRYGGRGNGLLYKTIEEHST